MVTDTGRGADIPHILLLEDDQAHQDLVLRAFRDDSGQFRVSVAGTLRAAREILARDPPALIIADWNLPDGKGIDILPRVNGMVKIPLMIMTSHGDEKLAVEIMKSGAMDYIVKSATAFQGMPFIARRALRNWEVIRQRDLAEKAVQESQKRLADILGFLPDAVFAIDREGRVIAWNKAIGTMTGVPPEEMLGKGDHEYSIPFYGERRPILIDLVLADDPEIEKKYSSVRHTAENTITAEVCIPGLYGGRGAVLWTIASPLLDSAGNRIGAVEAIRDITEKRHRESLLHRREAILETLLNAPHDTIALLDRRGIIIGINEEGAQRLGGTVQEVTGRCAYDLLPGEVAASRKARIDRVFETGEPVRFDDDRSGIYLHNEIYPFSTRRTRRSNISRSSRRMSRRRGRPVSPWRGARIGSGTSPGLSRISRTPAPKRGGMHLRSTGSPGRSGRSPVFRKTSCSQWGAGEALSYPKTCRFSIRISPACCPACPPGVNCASGKKTGRSGGSPALPNVSAIRDAPSPPGCTADARISRIRKRQKRSAGHTRGAWIPPWRSGASPGGRWTCPRVRSGSTIARRHSLGILPTGSGIIRTLPRSSPR